MENQSINNEIRTGDEVVPLDKARFLDRLEPRYEQQWSDLVEKAYETKETFEETLFPIWLDDSFPQAVRDRVMLLSMGKADIVEQIGGRWQGNYRGSFFATGFGASPYAHRYGHDQEYNQWVEEAVEYGDIIDDTILFRHSYKQFEAGEWSQEKFERILEWFDPERVQPTHYGGDWDDPGARLDVWRLPYIDDILRGVTTRKSDKKLQAWAQEKLALYRQNYLTNEEVLPVWLQELNPIAVMRFTIDEYRKLDQHDALPHNIIKSFELYGFRDHYFIDRTDRRRGFSLMDRLGELPQKVIIDYLAYRYNSALTRRENFPKDEEDLLIAHIHAPLPGTILGLRRKLNEMNAQNLKESVNEQKKLDDERSARIERETQQKKLAQEAMSRYRELMEDFRRRI